MDIILVIDMQNDFITGALANKSAQKILPSMEEFLKEEKEKGSAIIFTMDTHNKDNYLTSTEGIHLPVEHCIKGTKGWQIADELKAFVTDRNVIYKERFGESNLLKKIENIINRKLDKQDNIILVGTCTSICVLSNALILKAFTDTEINVIPNLCACITEETHNSAIKAMETAHVNIIEYKRSEIKSNWE